MSFFFNCRCCDLRSVSALNLGAFPEYAANCAHFARPASESGYLTSSPSFQDDFLESFNNHQQWPQLRTIVYSAVMRLIEGQSSAYEFHLPGYLSQQFGIDGNEPLDAILLGGSPDYVSGVDTFLDDDDVLWFPPVESEASDVVDEFLSSGGTVIVCLPALSQVPAHTSTTGVIDENTVALAAANSYFERIGAATRVVPLSHVDWSNWLRSLDRVKHFNLSGAGVLSPWSHESTLGVNFDGLLPLIHRPFHSFAEDRGNVLVNDDASTWLTSDDWYLGRNSELPSAFTQHPENRIEFIVKDNETRRVPESIVEQLPGGGRLVVIPSYGGGQRTRIDMEPIWHNLLAEKLGRNGAARAHLWIDTRNEELADLTDVGTAIAGGYAAGVFTAQGSRADGHITSSYSPYRPGGLYPVWFAEATDAIRDRDGNTFDAGWNLAERRLTTIQQPVDAPDTVPPAEMVLRITQIWTTEQEIPTGENPANTPFDDAALQPWRDGGLIDATWGSRLIEYPFSLGFRGSLVGTQQPLQLIEYLKQVRTITAIPVTDSNPTGSGLEGVELSYRPAIFAGGRLWIPEASAITEIEWQTDYWHREISLTAFVANDGSGDVLDLLSHDLFEIMVVINLEGLEWGRDGLGAEEPHYNLDISTLRYNVHLSPPVTGEEL